MTYLGPVAHDSGNGNLPIHRLVVHCTAGADAKGARGTAAYFRDPNATGSAHEVIDPKEVIICAYDTVICWHAPPNTHSKGYELACSLSNDGKGHWGLDSHQAMLRLLSKELARDAVKYDIPVRHLTVAQVKAEEKGICGHVDVSNAFHQSDHTDPGPYFPWSQLISMVAAEVAVITGGAGGTPSGPIPGDFTVSEADRVIAYVSDAYQDLKKTLTVWQEAKDNERQAALLGPLNALTATLHEFMDSETSRYSDQANRVQNLTEAERTRYQDYVGRFTAVLAAVADVRQALVPAAPVEPPVVVPPKS